MDRNLLSIVSLFLKYFNQNSFLFEYFNGYLTYSVFRPATSPNECNC